MPSDMMLCVISYWVLSGAKRRQIQQLRCCVLPTKLLKRRDVYLKLTRHNGRAGTHGTYNPKHNDRSFNLANSEHIDQERAKGNIYWDCYHGIRSASDKDKQTAAFSDVEKMFYEIHYSHFVENQNCASRKGFKVPLNFPVQASVPPLSGVFQQCIARRTKRLAPCPMHATTIPAHHEGNGFGLLFLVQVLKSFLFYTQLAQSNRLVEEKADHLYAVCLLPDAKARRRAGLTAPARARCRPVPSARCLAYTAPCCHRRTAPSW